MSITDPSQYKTGAAVPSNAAKDLSDNARVFDVVTTSNDFTEVIDRLGNTRMTLKGFEERAISAIGEYALKDKGLYLPNPVTLSTSFDFVTGPDGESFFAKNAPYTTRPAVYADPKNDPNLFIGSYITTLSLRQSQDRIMGYTFKGNYLPDAITLTNEGDYVLDDNGNRWFGVALPYTTDPTTYPDPSDDVDHLVSAESYATKDELDKIKGSIKPYVICEVSNKNGTVNMTTEFLQHFDLSDGLDRYIPSGTYLVDCGVFKINYPNGLYMPRIETGANVKFILANGTSGDLWQIKGGDNWFLPNSIQNGWIGNMQVSSENPTPPLGTPGQNFVSMTTVSNVDFGVIVGDGLYGDLVNIPLATTDGAISGNPDYWSVAGCHFKGLIMRNGSFGYLVNNKNGNGFNFNTFEFMQANDCTGVWSGGGAVNTIKSVTAGGCTGELFTLPETHPGSTNRIIVEKAELDGNKRNITVKNGQGLEFKQVRIVHRYNASEVKYWPSTSVQLGSTTSSIYTSSFDFEFLVAAGGNKSDLTLPFISCNNTANFINSKINATVRDDAGLGFNNQAEIVGNIVPSADLIVTNGNITVNTPSKTLGCLFSISKGASLPPLSYGTITSLLKFDVVLENRRGLYNSDGKYYVYTSGVYKLEAKLSFDATINTNSYIGFMRDRNGALTMIQSSKLITPASQFNSIYTHGSAELIAGDIIFAICQATAGEVNAQFASNAECFMSIEYNPNM